MGADSAHPGPVDTSALFKGSVDLLMRYCLGRQLMCVQCIVVYPSTECSLIFVLCILQSAKWESGVSIEFN